MSSLSACIKKAGKNLFAEDKSAVLEAARVNRQAGMSTLEAAKAAVRSRREEVQALLVAEQKRVSTRTLDATEAKSQVVAAEQEATHKDPGQPAEAATAEVVSQSITKAAKNEERPRAEMRSELLAMIDAKMADAKPADDADVRMYEATAPGMKMTDAQAAEYKRLGQGSSRDKFMKRLESERATTHEVAAQNIGYVTFDVPGDGKFKVLNTRSKLEDFRKRVEQSPGFKDQRYREPGMTDASSGGKLAAFTGMVDDGDMQAALDYAAATGLDPKTVKLSDMLRKRLDKWMRDQEMAASVAAREEQAAAPTAKPDTTHLNALMESLSRERGRLAQAATPADRAAREVKVAQIEREIAGERKFLGLPAEELPNMTDDEMAAELAPTAPALDLMGFERTPKGNDVFELRDGNMLVRVEPTGRGTFQASHGSSAKSGPRLTEQQAIEWAANLRDESKRLQVPASAPAAANRLTEAQARKAFEWRDLGTKDGTRTYALFFADPADGRSMRYGEVTLFKGSTRFAVDGGEGAATLKAAKAEAEQLALVRLAKDGYAETPADPAPNDRDSFTLERGAANNTLEKVTFKRGEYITFRIGEGGKQSFGEIDGISHARRQFSVDGLWHDFGFAYKAERPAPAVKTGTVPLSSVIDKVNKKYGQGLTDADKVPEKTASKTPMVDAHMDLFKAVRAGTATPEAFKAMYAQVRDGKDAILAELNTSTKDQLLKDVSGYVRPETSKTEIMEAIYKGLLNRFALGKDYGPNSYMMGQEKAYEKAKRDAFDALVEGQTAESLAQYASESKAEFEAEMARRSALVESIKNPKTLEEYRRFMSFHTRDGKSTTEVRRAMLTPEQRAEFDLMLADESRGKRTAAKDEQRTSVRVAGQTVDGDIIATKHTKKGHDLFVVKLSERVSREDYETLNAGAKRIGGYYSSFRGGGAIPGFQFTTRDQAQAFVTLAGGDNTAAVEAAKERRDAFQDDRSQTAAERLTEMADRLEERADESLGRERKANTARRASFAASAEAAAQGDKAMAKTMRNIASAITAGTAKFLDRVRQKTQVEMLQGYVRTAKDAEIRAKHQSYVDQERHKGERPTGETADYAEFPSFTAYRSDLASLGRQLLDVDGTKLFGQRLMKVADDVSDAYLAFAKEPGNLFRLSTFSVRSGEDVRTAIFPSREVAERAIKRSGLTAKAIAFQEKRGVHRIIMSPSLAMEQGIWKGDGDKRITLDADFGAELVEKMGRANRRGTKVSVPWQFESAYDRRKAMARMGIETPAEFRSALREFIGLREAPAAPDKVKELERAMIGRRNDGLDFFPTPEETADAMVEAADIKPGMRVLEPSAGMGHIAERIRAIGTDPDVIEFSNDRRELLEAKGFNVQGRDFLEFTDANHDTRGFTFGDVFRAPDGTLGVMRGSNGMGGSRVGLDPLDETGAPDMRRSRWESFEDLEPVEKRGVGSGYDRILMNPPFSDGRDIQHVRHAYDLLKPGGRLVALMGESAFTNQNKRATEFREWLEGVGGTEEKLPEGTFNDPSLPVNTGANARMVVIEKQEGAANAPMFSRSRRMGAVSPRQLREAVARITADWDQDLADVQVVNRVEDLPADIQQAVRNVGSESTVRGLAMPDGRVYLVAENISTVDEGRFVLFHEVYGHVGMRAFLGDAYAAQMRTLKQANPSLSKEADAWFSQYGEDEISARVSMGMAPLKARQMVQALAVEEALADRAGNAPELKGWQAMMALLQRALRRMRLGSVADMLEGMTQAETLNLLRQARQTVRGGQSARAQILQDRPAFSSRQDFTPQPEVATGATEQGHPEFATAKVSIAFPQVAERFEVIPGQGQEVVSYAIMPPDSFDVLGHVELLVENGRPVSLLDIEVYRDKGRGKGIGRAVIEALLAANPEADLNISNIVPEARGFWEQMGVPQQNVEGAYDGTLNWQTYSANNRAAGRDAPGRGGSRQGRTAEGAGPRASAAGQGQVGPLFSRRAAQSGIITVKQIGPGWAIVRNQGTGNEQHLGYFDTEQEAGEQAERARTTAGKGNAPWWVAPGAGTLRSTGVGRLDSVDRQRAVQATLDARRNAVKSPAEGLALPQDPARAGYCFQTAAEASASGVGSMVIGRASFVQDGWHAVVVRDGMTYDATLARWFEPGVYEAMGFTADKTLTTEQVRDYVASTGRSPDARNQGLTGSAPMFSRALPDRAALREVIPPAVQEWVSDRMVSQRGFNRIWHRTVGTQLHKAKTNKEFGRAYYAVQDYMKDVSRMATLAAEKAPDMLPQIESLGDLARLAPTLASPAAYKQRKADIKAASDAMFDGTLRYARDEHGEAVKVDPDSDELGGLVWTDDELRSRGLSERAVKMYRQSRAAIGQSLDNMLAADLYRQVSVMAPEMVASDPGDYNVLMDGLRRAAASDTPGDAVRSLGDAIRDRLDGIQTALDGQPNQYTPGLMQRRQDLHKLQEMIGEKVQRIQDLKDSGYAPLMRFGPYAVDVVNPDGRRVFFGMYESQAAANKAARKFQGDGLVVTQSVMPQKQFEALQGVSPETALLFAEMLGVEKNEAMQVWLKNAVAEQSALKRHIRRKGIEGFDEDGGRVLAAFMTSNARAASRALHSQRISDAVESISQGDVQDEARALAEYVSNPKEEAQAIRSLLFVQYIGGSIASAIVNLTQTVVQTFPFLSQYGGGIKAGRRIGAAMKIAAGGKIADKDLAAAVARAEKDGIIKPQEVFQLQAEASRNLGSNLYVRSLLAAWGSMFQLAEVFNRRVAFIAAYTTAKEQGIADPFSFAENAVDETQGVFNKGNRPNWARGAVGSTVFTFKTFTIQYVEFLKRLATAGEPGSPERARGRKAAALALLALLLLAGMKGMPFADDAEDLIDTVAQALGYNWTTDAQIDKWMDDTLGQVWSDIFQHGLSGVPGVPFDVSQRLGMQNLLPGTGLLKQSETNKQNQVLEVFGVVGAAVRDATQGQFFPIAIRNLMVGLDTYETGLYRDRRGRGVTEADTLDAALKAIGLQPNNVARAQRDIGRQIELRSLYQSVKEEITDSWAQARFAGDADGINNARASLQRWNDMNPEARIIILPRTIEQRVIQMRRSKAERTIANAPKPLRASTAEALQ